MGALMVYETRLVIAQTLREPERGGAETSRKAEV